MRKWGSDGQNLKKIMRLNFQNLVFLLVGLLLKKFYNFTSLQNNFALHVQVVYSLQKQAYLSA